MAALRFNLAITDLREFHCDYGATQNVDTIFLEVGQHVSDLFKIIKQFRSRAGIYT